MTLIDFGEPAEKDAVEALKVDQSIAEYEFKLDQRWRDFTQHYQAYHRK